MNLVENQDDISIMNDREIIMKNEDLDFILVYKNTHNIETERRQYFEDKLQEMGLVLKTEQMNKLNFVKINVPTEVLCRYCEIMKVRMPIIDISNLNVDKLNNARSRWKSIRHFINEFVYNIFGFNRSKKKYRWTAEFSANQDYLFDINSAKFFTPSLKCMIVNFIVERCKFGPKQEDVGIVKLLNSDVYKAAYALHDGSVTTEESERKFFATEWASFHKVLKYQPLDYIKDYFGVKLSLYFAWLGFYTVMLIPASIFGVLTMIYGGLTRSTDAFSNDVCDTRINFTMCPTCDQHCDYWNLIDACQYAKVTHLFDNYGTICFAFFMSIWSALYLELWKRYSAKIKHKWGLSGFDLEAEHPRPQYLARLANAKKKINIITNQEEPAVPFFRVRLPSIVLSFSFAFIWVSLAVAAVFGVVIYRMAGSTINFFISDGTNQFTPFFVPITAGFINLICIFGLNFVYDKLSLHLTEFEYQRTQMEFDDSLALKMYMFQFVNYYSSVFYIAFLKGKLVGYPKKYNRIFGFRQEECSLGGCMMELFIQLAIIMIGKQAINSFLEIGVPMFNNMRAKKNTQQQNIEESNNEQQWFKDYKLLPWDSRVIFSEYLEMVIQYGFVTIFVSAFPLAPLFALINNIFEMRLDAKKFLNYYRRPITKRVKDIGIWFYIMDIIGQMSIISNAIIIAFSSNFIPKMVYHNMYPERGDVGFLNFSLAYFDVQDFQQQSIPLNTKYNNVTQCRYAEYRYSKNFDYKKSLTYWHILVGRLAFIIIFQNVVRFVVNVIQWAIPDIPKKLNDKIKQESLRTSEYIIQKETEKYKRNL